MTKILLQIPEEVSQVTSKLVNAGYEAWLVGGCVRDLLLNIEPNDWDVTTNATPEEIQGIFEHTFYENNFGTVGVVNDDISDRIIEIEQNNVSRETFSPDSPGFVNNLESQDVSRETSTNSEKIVKHVSHGRKTENVSRETFLELNRLKKLKIVEVTPYRLESAYSDSRHPDEVVFSQNIDDDLARRDFTVNAICYSPETSEIYDLYGGIADIQAKTIKCVGDPTERFTEDALRMLRAARLANQLGFNVSCETSEAIIRDENLVKHVSQERIQDEFNKLLMSPTPMDGVLLLANLHLVKHVSQELTDCVNVKQNGIHVYDVYEHLLRTLQHSADKGWGLEIRLAALFHDISKPETRRFSKEKNDYTFYGHEVVGSRVTKKILKRLKYSNEIVEKVSNLVRWHMFFSDPDEVSLSAVRRMIRNAGGENEVWDLLKLRICDRIGMGRPKEKSYRLRKYEAMMDNAMRSPVSVRDLKFNGDQMIADFNFKPGKRMGWVLHALMDETLDTPENNNYDYLSKKALELDKLGDDELFALYEKGKKAIETAEEAEQTVIRKKHKIARG